MLEVADFYTSFNHSIISPLLSVWIQSPHKAHVRQVKFCSPITAIRITSPCYINPLIPNFYKVKLEFTGVYLFFFSLATKHALWVLMICHDLPTLAGSQTKEMVLAECFARPTNLTLLGNFQRALLIHSYQCKHVEMPAIVIHF